MNANTRQVAGSHYQAGIQHWDYVLRALAGRYLEGNITKYVTRHRKKNGLQDLQKAMHYLDKLIEEHRAGRVSVLTHGEIGFPMHDFVAQNGLNTTEAYIVKRLAHWYRLDHLEAVRVHIEALIEDERSRDSMRQAVKAGAASPDLGLPTGPEPAEPGKGYVNQG